MLAHTWRVRKEPDLPMILESLECHMTEAVKSLLYECRYYIVLQPQSALAFAGFSF
jgi:hypothetical protein